MTLSTKLEVHDILALLLEKNRTTAEVSRRENFIQFVHVIFKHASGQTDRQTNTKIAMLRTS